MKLFLIRHGDADAEVPEGLDDEARPLTARGRLALTPHFANLASRIGTPGIILCSPLVRAVQTATLLSHALRFEGPLKVTRTLFPDSPIGAIEGFLQTLTEQSVVLVGHQPSMGATAAHFLGYASFPKPVAPGTVIGIERSETASKLLFYALIGQPVSDS